MSYNTTIEAQRRTKFTLISLIPQSIEGKQVVGEVTYSPEPNSVYLYKGNKYAEWDFKGKKIPSVIEIRCRIELNKYNLAKKHRVEKLSKKEKRKYLKRERYIEVGRRSLKNALNGIPTNTNDLKYVENITDFVVKHMETTQATREMLGAEKALKLGRGDCTEYADLLVALARQAGLPARHISGYIVTKSTSFGHSWAEVYTKEKGWITVDPLHIDIGSGDFTTLENKYIAFSDIRNDPELSQGMLYSWKVDNSTGARVRVKIKVQDRN